MSEVKRYRYLLDEAVMESVGSNPSYRTAEGPAWMDADEVTTRIAELEAERDRLQECVDNRDHDLEVRGGHVKHEQDKVAELEAENRELRESRTSDYLSALGIAEEDICEKCGGLGRRAYGNTSTWHGGVGGQVITGDVCDVCWGTGSKSERGANLRTISAEMQALRNKIAALEDTRE